MTNLPQLATALQSLLTTTADAVARATGFTQRRSPLTGARFAQTLVFAWLANAAASREELSQTTATCGTPLSPQALDHRFTPAAAAFLQDLLGRAVQTLIAADPVAIPLLQRFAGVYLLASSTVGLPPTLASLWPGCGGYSVAGTGAALKLQVRLDLVTGSLAGPFLQAGRANDGSAPTQTLTLPKGAVRIADLGYFTAEVLHALAEQGVSWLSRLEASAVVFDAQGRRWAPAARLQTHESATVDLAVQVGLKTRLPARVLAVRVPQAVADERRRKLRLEARRKQRAPSAASLALAAWTVFLTNVPADRLSVDEAVVLGRARWQIELLFKVWKSHGRIAESRSQNPWRVLCELYAKLLVMVVQHWILLLGCWRYPDRSLRKAAHTGQKHALQLASSISAGVHLIETITAIQRCLARGCRLNKRRAKPPTYQRLLSMSD